VPNSAQINPGYDTTGWTVYEPAEFLCIDAYTGNINTSGGIKPVFILELYNDERKVSITKFFNCKKTKKGNLAVNKNSDFACIYRTSVGEDPRPRYSKAKQLLGHLIGISFLCEFQEAKDRNDSLYFRATKIQPVNPQASDEWFLNGKLKNKRGVKGRRYSPSIYGLNIQKSYKQKPDNNEAIIRKKVGNELESEYLANPSTSVASSAILSTYIHTTPQGSSVESLRHKDYVDVEEVSETEHVYRYSRAPDESYDDYIDSVLNDSLSRW
jgi:hypothetical protein